MGRRFKLVIQASQKVEGGSSGLLFLSFIGDDIPPSDTARLPFENTGSEIKKLPEGVPPTIRQRGR
jgi:hypothetical protein